MSNTHQLQILLPGTKNGFCKPNVAFSGDPKTDRNLLAAFISGVPLTVKGPGTVDIAGTADEVCGFLVYDAAGTGPWDGMGGADQSGVVTYVYGLATVEFPTRVLKSGDTFAPGHHIYNAGNGQITSTDPGGAKPLGIILDNTNMLNDQLAVQLSI
jgi:hypothetical protein